MNFLRRLLGGADPVVPLGEDAAAVATDQRLDGEQLPSPVDETFGVADFPGESAAADEHVTAEASKVDTKPLPEEAVTTAVGTRPLPAPPEVVPVPGQYLRFGQRSDVGMVRGNNQDSMLGLVMSSTSADEFPELGVFVVADGMGGHQEGERASAITVRTVTMYIVREIVAVMLDQHMSDPDRPSISDVLRAAVREANEAVAERIPEGGTTVTATIMVGDLAYIAHVGDSRAYLVTADGIEQITRDHSLVQRLIELDQLTPEEAAEHPQRNVLYRAVGQSESLDVDVVTRRLSPHTHLLLCSDGLWNMVPEATLLEVIRSQEDPQAACNELVRMANERGGPDNITLIIVRVPG